MKNLFKALFYVCSGSALIAVYVIVFLILGKWYFIVLFVLTMLVILVWSLKLEFDLTDLHKKED